MEQIIILSEDPIYRSFVRRAPAPMRIPKEAKDLMDFNNYPVIHIGNTEIVKPEDTYVTKHASLPLMIQATASVASILQDETVIPPDMENSVPDVGLEAARLIHNRQLKNCLKVLVRQNYTNGVNKATFINFDEMTYPETFTTQFLTRYNAYKSFSG